MAETRRQRKPIESGRAGTELRVVRIDCDPGPDAEDRLRRLFTLLVKLAARDKLPAREDRTGAEG